jgi:hypothetical protein
LVIEVIEVTHTHTSCEATFLESAAESAVLAGAVEVRRRRHHVAVEQLEISRAIRNLSVALPGSSFRQADIAQIIGISQPALSKALNGAQSVPEPADGFSGASPYEILLRFDAGLLSREQLIDELSRWNYPPYESADPDGDYIPSNAGTEADITRALDEGIVDEELYMEIVDAIIGRAGT